MKAKVAVATVSGKTYFLVVNELKERNMEFLSLVPGDPVPAEAKVVITTEKEKHLISHEKHTSLRQRHCTSQRGK